MRSSQQNQSSLPISERFPLLSLLPPLLPRTLGEHPGCMGHGFASCCRKFRGSGRDLAPTLRVVQKNSSIQGRLSYHEPVKGMTVVHWRLPRAERKYPALAKGKLGVCQSEHKFCTLILRLFTPKLEPFTSLCSPQQVSCAGSQVLGKVKISKDGNRFMIFHGSFQ